MCKIYADRVCSAYALINLLAQKILPMIFIN